jgi:hypothetical protein
MDTLTTDDGQVNSMMIAEQQAIETAEAASHYFQITALMSETSMPEFDRQEFVPPPEEVAILPVQPATMAMLDPGTGGIVVAQSDFPIIASGIANDQSATPTTSAETFGSTSGVAAGLDGGAPIDISAPLDLV